jgi:hypothetical protein
MFSSEYERPNFTHIRNRENYRHVFQFTKSGDVRHITLQQAVQFSPLVHQSRMGRSLIVLPSSISWTRRPDIASRTWVTLRFAKTFIVSKWRNWAYAAAYSVEGYWYDAAESKKTVWHARQS